MTGEAMVGPLAGERLRWIPTEVTTWGAWKKRHPETTALQPPFAAKEYAETNRHYVAYREGKRPRFPTGPTKPDKRFEPMTIVTILLHEGKARCYPHPLLNEGETKDGGLRIEKQKLTVRAYDAEGKEIPTMQGYWFAWTAFHEGGSVYEKPGE